MKDGALCRVHWGRRCSAEVRACRPLGAGPVSARGRQLPQTWLPVGRCQCCGRRAFQTVSQVVLLLGPHAPAAGPALVCGDEASSHSPCRSGQAPRSPFAVVLSVLRPSPLPPSDSQVLQPHPAWVGKPHPILVSLHHFVRASAFLGIRLDPYLGQLDPPKLRKARRAFHQS